MHHEYSATAANDYDRNADYNNDACSWNKPDAPATPSSGAGARSDFINGTFKVADFPVPPRDPVTGAYLREGNIGRDVYRGPGLAQFDVERD